MSPARPARLKGLQGNRVHWKGVEQDGEVSTFPFYITLATEHRLDFMGLKMEPWRPVRRH